MTTRYSDRGANVLFQDPDGPFVHYLDYEELQQKLAALPADWNEDSSLETWFPFTARRIETS